MSSLNKEKDKDEFHWLNYKELMSCLKESKAICNVTDLNHNKVKIKLRKFFEEILI